MKDFVPISPSMTTSNTPTDSALPANTPPESFEAAVAELEALVDEMDSQNTGLDQLLTDYKRGAFLVKYCRDRLSVVRKEVAQIESDLLRDAQEGEQ